MVDLKKCPELNNLPVAKELAPARLHSSRSSVNSIVLKHRDGWFWGRFAAQREQAPSPQEVVAPPWHGFRPRFRASQNNEFANNGAARKGRRFVLCLHLETL